MSLVADYLARRGVAFEVVPTGARPPRCGTPGRGLGTAELSATSR
jgi:hypothetical protein